MLAGALCLVLVAFFYMQNSAQTPLPVAATQNPASSTVRIGGETLRVTVAATEAARERGLSGRTGLLGDEGMLFVFPRDGTYAFWMKDMLFSIDIIWISPGGRIVHVAPNVSPATYPEDFVSPASARYVLEVPAGFVDAHGVKVGDIVGL